MDDDRKWITTEWSAMIGVKRKTWFHEDAWGFVHSVGTRTFSPPSDLECCFTYVLSVWLILPGIALSLPPPWTRRVFFLVLHVFFFFCIFRGRLFPSLRVDAHGRHHLCSRQGQHAGIHAGHARFLLR